MKSKPGSLFAQFARNAAEFYSADLHRFLARRMHRPHDIEDLAQEVYIRLLKIHQGEFVKNPKAYILQTAANVEYDFRERHRRANKFVVVDSEVVEEASANLPDETRGDPAQRLSTEKQLNAALAKLSPIHQTVLVMRYREEYSYGEIAKALKVTVRQVERYLANAKEALMTVDWEWD